jgi:hypothetical protein
MPEFPQKPEMNEQFHEQFQEEIEVLKSIYYNEQIEVTDDGATYEVLFADHTRKLNIRFTLDKFAYPNTAESLKVIVDENFSRIREIEKTALNLFASHLGEVALYRLIEEIISIFECTKPVEQLSSALVPQTTIPEDEVVQVLSCCPNSVTIHHGPITTERKSSFQSHFSTVQNMSEVNDFWSAVMSDKRVARATHNIFAYRFTDVAGLVHHDCDDDGETAAGSRLAETLRLMGVNNVAVIVTRWFGGVLLGPDRFKYICNSARNLLESNGIADSLKSSKHKK